VIHFTFALFELAGDVVDAMLWSALAPLAILVVLAGGVYLVRRRRRR
jgi:LPXTG-motif cell wall-anchored protein